MAKNTKSITLSVHRAIISDSIPWSLSDILATVRENLPTEDQVLDRGFWNQVAANFPQFPKTNEAIAAQFALYEKGAQKSTIKRPDATRTYSTSPVAAPEDSEFLDHEVAVLCEGNYLIACGLNKRHTILIDTICRFAEKCGMAIPAGAISLIDPPNQLTVEAIRDKGVKAIRFDAGNFLGSLDEKSGGIIGHIFGSPSSPADFDREGMVAQLNIHPKRAKKTTIDYIEKPKNQWLQEAAVMTFEEEAVEVFTIVLDDESEWPSGKLKLNKSIEVLKDGGSSYKVSDALGQMLEYFENLKRNQHIT